MKIFAQWKGDPDDLAIYVPIELTAVAPPKINIDDAFAELNGELVLNFRNAKTGAPVSNATITFQGQTFTTDSSGKITALFQTLESLKQFSTRPFPKRVCIRQNTRHFYGWHNLV